MQMDRLTIKAVEAVQQAERTAQSLGHAELTPVHLLAALVGSAAPLGQQDGDVGQRQELEGVSNPPTSEDDVERRGSARKRGHDSV